jgi:hypothetical protein
MQQLQAWLPQLAAAAAALDWAGLKEDPKRL